MPTERQIAANRTNSLKSTGPLTPNGKLKSSRNGLRHGLLARTVVLKGESLNRFMLLMDRLHEQFQPQNAVEHTLVEKMAVATWRQTRLWAMEKADLSHAIEKLGSSASADDVQKQDAPTRAVLAFRNLSAQGHSLDLMNRYEARFDRQYNLALKMLLNLRKNDDCAKRTQFFPE